MARTPTPEGYVDAPAYLQVRPTQGPYSRRTDGAAVVRATQTKPDAPIPGTLLVKVTLRIPVAAFSPLEPEAVVVVPTSMVEATPVEVEAEDPRD